jgi:hypothetical protein
LPDRYFGYGLYRALQINRSRRRSPLRESVIARSAAELLNRKIRHDAVNQQMAREDWCDYCSDIGAIGFSRANIYASRETAWRR